MDKKQKILIVHNYYQIPGGEDTVVSNEKKMLEDNGHKVVLHTRHNTELKTLNKFEKLTLPFTSVFSFKIYFDIKKLIKSESIDVVHVHNTLTLISPAVYYASIKLKKPVVQTIHNFRFLCPAATFYRDGKICEDCLSNGLKCAVKHSCYRNSKIQTLLCVINTKIHRLTGIYKKINYICLTDFNKEKLLQHGQIKEEQIYIKPNFINSNLDVIPYDKRENQIVFVGRIDKLKGIDILLKTWKLLKSNKIKLLICGTGLMEQWCNNYIKENKLKNVEIKGFIPNDKAKEFIANSKALILPTQWYEGFPMTVVEAFTVGTPVIGSNIGNVGNLIVENENGFKFSNEQELKNILETKLQTFSGLDEKWINKYSQIENYKMLKDIYNNI
ncbi:MAG: glycosyltransferase family 4 protein [Clostridia bacterium]